MRSASCLTRHSGNTMSRGCPAFERRDLGLVGGKQDHYAAAFGGSPAGIQRHPKRIRSFARHLRHRSIADATEIIGEQTAGAVDHRATTIAAFDRLKADAIEMKTRLLSGNMQCNR